MEKQGVIYKIENLVDGKVYVGRTIQTFEARVLHHKSSLRRNKHFNVHLQNAWNKYGQKNFKFELIQECEVPEVDSLEMYWIDFFQSTIRKYGYNLTFGGDGMTAVTEETRIKMSESRFIKVVLVNTGEVFDSIKEASAKYGVGSNSITMCCKKERNFAGRLPNGEWMVWRYLDEYDSKEDFSFKMKRANNKKTITCLSTNETFQTIKSAAEKFNLERRAISKTLNGWQKSCLSPTHGRLQFVYGISHENPKELDDVKKKRSVICLTTKEKFESLYQAAKHYNISSISNLKNCCESKRNYCGKGANGEKLKWAYYDEHLSR